MEEESSNGENGNVRRRIEKDISIFSSNIKLIRNADLTPIEQHVVELSEMYAKDSESWLEKGDYYTSFSSISYAHGLLDSILKIKGMSE